MHASDLKINIIDQIIHSQDDDLMREIQFILQLHSPQEEPIQLTPTMLEAIQESEAQIAEGNYQDSEAVWNEIDQWLDGK